jgi:hypothetical protein
VFLLKTQIINQKKGLGIFTGAENACRQYQQYANLIGVAILEKNVNKTSVKYLM